jgi:TetR/AcrR family transcriptional repressor of mexJK operon
MPPASLAVSPRSVTRRSAGRPTRDDADVLRALYLEIALETFLARGYEGTSIEEIARVAKAGKVTFYRQFGSKSELFHRVAQHAIAKARERLHSPQALRGRPDHVLPELIERLHIALTDPAYLAILRLVIAERGRFPELGESLLANDRTLLQPVVEYLEKAAAAGELAVPDAYAGAMQLAALAAGGSRFLLKEPRTDAKSRRQWVKAVAHFVMAAWKPVKRK